MFVLIFTMAFSSYAQEPYINDDAGYSVDLSKYKDIKETITKTDTVNMAVGVTGYLVKTKATDYSMEYLVIGPMGQPRENILEVISESLDGQAEIIGKKIEDCDFNLCLSYTYLISINGIPKAVEASTLFVHKGQLLHLSVTVMHSDIVLAGDFNQEVIEISKQRMAFLLSIVTFK